MAIEIQPGAGRMQPVSGGPESARPWWMKPAVHTGIIGGIIGYLVGHWLGNALSYDYAQNALSDTNDVPIVLGYVFWGDIPTLGLLLGSGIVVACGLFLLWYETQQRARCALPLSIADRAGMGLQRS